MVDLRQCLGNQNRISPYRHLTNDLTKKGWERYWIHNKIKLTPRKY